MKEVDIDSGVITREDRDGNEEADKLATLGVELHKVQAHGGKPAKNDARGHGERTRQGPGQEEGRKAGPQRSTAKVSRAKDGTPRGTPLRRQGWRGLAMHGLQQILHHLPRMEAVGQNA
eukprot:11262911-Heterocapsa_arctica.AAC.1